jgi:hypothetical protein
MSNCMRNRRSRVGPRPGDFPLGSLRSRAAARAVLAAQDLQAQEQNDALRRNLTPLEEAFIESSSDPTAPPSRALAMLCQAIEMKTKRFDMSPITPEYVRYRVRVLDEVAKIERERAAQGDTAFLDAKALWEMAGERLRRERRSIAQTGSTDTEASGD